MVMTVPSAGGWHSAGLTITCTEANATPAVTRSGPDGLGPSAENDCADVDQVMGAASGVVHAEVVLVRERGQHEVGDVLAGADVQVRRPRRGRRRGIGRI